MIQISNVVDYLEQWTPLSLQESYDNCGLLVGDASWELKGALISLDVTEAVVEEAIERGCNLIISHHPIIFKGLKKIVSQSYVERTVIKAIKNDIALYAIHTNLDNVWSGVNKKIADRLQLSETRILQPNSNFLKITFFVPATHTEQVLKAVHAAGAGNIGNYSACAFRTSGTGQFTPIEDANPYIGQKLETEFVSEERVEVICPPHLQNIIVKKLLKSHPYETPAYDVMMLNNSYPYSGAGRIGLLPQPMEPREFIQHLKQSLNVSIVRCSPLVNKKIVKVALCGGSGSSLFSNAQKQLADVYVSSDFKYHEFFDANHATMIADINHYEAEYFTKELIHEYLCQKFANIALVLSKINTNPISYL